MKILRVKPLDGAKMQQLEKVVEGLTQSYF